MREPGWMNLKMGEGSSISVAVPMVVGDAGYVNIVQLELRELDVTTSVDCVSFLLTPSLTVSLFVLSLTDDLFVLVRWLYGNTTWMECIAYMDL
jgi:hypothetical protein